MYKNDYVLQVEKQLQKKKLSLLFKWLFDRIVSFILLILLSPAFLILAIWIKKDSKGPVFFKQERITKNGKVFFIYKFRTMRTDLQGSQLTSNNDVRITKVGQKIRDKRLDELPQLINILKGEMSFVGTRPEVAKYVKRYQPNMNVTLLMPAGVTSTASIAFKDESELLEQYVKAGWSIDDAYVEKVLPEKMKYNEQDIEYFSFMHDMKIILKTVQQVLF